MEVQKIAGIVFFYQDPIFNPKDPSYLKGQVISANFLFNCNPLTVTCLKKGQTKIGGEPIRFQYFLKIFKHMPRYIITQL